MNRVLIPLLLASATLTAEAGTIYKCTTAEGGTLISNTKVDKSCRVVVTGNETSTPAPPKLRASAAANPSPASFPKVGEETQKARDTDRKRILEQELAAEQKMLEQARKELAEQEVVRAGEDKTPQKTLDRVTPYKERVSQHERNIAAISKELSGLK